MIEVKELSKRYGEILAVDQVSFQVQKGEILGFLGPNGAGKSTTMKMLTCFISPTGGTATIGGKDILKDSLEVRKLIGYLPESAPSYKDMNVTEFLSFIAEIRGFNRNEKKEKVSRVIELTFLKEVRYQTIDTLSKGYRQRVGFAQALIHDPPVLILDEPTDGLDPNQKHEVRTLIRNMSKEKVIVLSTHILEEMEAVCSRAIIINEGKIVADGTPESLLAQSDVHNAVTLKFSEDGDYQDQLKTIPGVSTVKKQSSKNNGVLFKIFPEQKVNILNNITNFVREKGWSMDEIHLEKGRLDEVFRRITLGDNRNS